jgi:hypothetical protein
LIRSSIEGIGEFGSFRMIGERRPRKTGRGVLTRDPWMTQKRPLERFG